MLITYVWGEPDTADPTVEKEPPAGTPLLTRARAHTHTRRKIITWCEQNDLKDMQASSVLIKLQLSFLDLRYCDTMLETLEGKE